MQLYQTRVASSYI